MVDVTEINCPPSRPRPTMVIGASTPAVRSPPAVSDSYLNEKVTGEPEYVPVIGFPSLSFTIVAFA